MWRLVFDENFNMDLWAAVEQRYLEPNLDVVRLSTMDLAGARDETVLAWAAQEERILLTHDARTIPPLAYARVTAGLARPGVIVVRGRLPYAAAIADLHLLLSASTPQEWAGRVTRLPYGAPVRGHAS